MLVVLRGRRWRQAQGRWVWAVRAACWRVRWAARAQRQARWTALPAAAAPAPARSANRWPTISALSRGTAGRASRRSGRPGPGSATRRAPAGRSARRCSGAGDFSRSVRQRSNRHPLGRARGRPGRIGCAGHWRGQRCRDHGDLLSKKRPAKLHGPSILAISARQRRVAGPETRDFSRPGAKFSGRSV